jgi:hypothetical protein
LTPDTRCHGTGEERQPPGKIYGGMYFFLLKIKITIFYISLSPSLSLSLTGEEGVRTLACLPAVSACAHSMGDYITLDFLLKIKIKQPYSTSLSLPSFSLSLSPL